MSKWTVINDSKVRSIWECTDKCGSKSVEIEPTFYSENGTPVCECGYDMVYVRTEILK